MNYVEQIIEMVLCQRMNAQSIPKQIITKLAKGISARDRKQCIAEIEKRITEYEKNGFVT